MKTYTRYALLHMATESVRSLLMWDNITIDDYDVVRLRSGLDRYYFHFNINKGHKYLKVTFTSDELACANFIIFGRTRNIAVFNFKQNTVSLKIPKLAELIDMISTIMRSKNTHRFGDVGLLQVADDIAKHPSKRKWVIS